MFSSEEPRSSQRRNWFKRGLRLIVLAVLSFAGPGAVLADEVTDWNQHTINTILTAKASSIATMRILAVKQAAVFDAVNGIERRFTHIYVRPDGPRRASSRTAAILGDDITFTHGSDTLPEVTRTQASFSEAAEEANESRIFTGAHFRSSSNDGQKAGAAPGNFTITNLARVNRDKNHNLFDAEGNAESVSSAPPCSSPMTVNLPALPNGTQGADYSITLKASGGYPPQAEVGWLVSAGALPDGLMLNSASGVLSGIPTAAGTYNFTVKAYKSGYYNCSGERDYTITIKAASATTLTVSDNPVTTGQAITLTAQVSASGITPTGTVQFTVNGSPVGSAVPLAGGSASFNITAPSGGSKGFFTASASYSGDGNSLPSSHSLTITAFDLSVQDDRTDDILFFSASGAYIFRHCAGELIVLLKGKGTSLLSGCPVFFQHFTSDRELAADVDFCGHTGSATVVYHGVTHTLTDSDMKNNMNFCR